MVAPPLAFASGALLALAGLVCWITGISRRSHQIAGALLLVWGVTGVASASVADSANASEALANARLSFWYGIPVPLFMILLVRDAIPDGRRRWVDATALVGIGALAALCFVALAARPTWIIEAVARDVDGQWRITSGPLAYAFALSAAAAEAFAIVRIGMLLAEGSLEAVARSHGILLGLALALPLLHNGAFFTSFSVPNLGSAPPGQIVRALGTIGLALAALPFLRRILRAFGTSRVPFGVLATAVAIGLIDGVVGSRRYAGISYGGYEASFAIVRVVFGSILAIALVRFGLAGLGAEERRRAKTALRAASVIAIAILTLFVGSVLLGDAPVATLVAGTAALILPVAAWPSSARLADRLLLPPDDPRAVAERARTYAAAVAASQGGGVEGEKLLAQMRADLGISAQEHELLVHGVASREKDRYHKVGSLGAGSTAQVELAVDEIAGRKVVVKRFMGLRDPGAVLKEARALAAVRHPRVVPFLEVDKRGEEVYLVLAYAEGGNARQLLEREGPLPPARAIALARDLLEGLEALHAAGIVHCDVKLENLLLDAEGRGLLGDFGSARFSAPDLADATLTGGAAEGSLSTIAPEALRGAAPAPERDVYAAGAVLYRLLTGKHYVDLQEATVFEAHERIRLDEPRLSDPLVPSELIPVLRKALAKKPVDRYRSAREFRDALVTPGARARP